MNNEDEPILVRKPENTRNIDDPKNAKYVLVETDEEKGYIEWLRDKGTYSVLGLRSKLTGMRKYKKWNEVNDNGD